MEKNHREFILAVHDFTPPLPLNPATPSQNSVVVQQPPIGAGDFGNLLKEKKRSQLFVDAKEIRENYTLGYYLMDFWLTYLEGLIRTSYSQ